jgi:5'-nucleotidase
MNAEAYISAYAREAEGNVLILDAGDGLHGQTVTNLSRGAAMVEVMNEVGYSAAVPGNHDFSYGAKRLCELATMMDFPLLAANVRNTRGSLLFEQYAVFPVDGMKVGVFGLVTPETAELSDPRLMADLTFDDPVKTAEEAVNALKAEGCGIIVALTHLGFGEMSAAENRSDTLAGVPGIDVIIDGHSHTILENGKTAGNTLIAQTGEYGEYIGVVELNLSGVSFTKSARLIPVPQDKPAAGLETDEKINAKIAALTAETEPLTSAAVGYTPVELQGEKQTVRTRETNLSNIITDSVRYATGADAAFLSGGNIRESIPAGDITMGHVLNTLPYSNLLVTARLTGAELVAVLEHGVSMYPEPAGQFIHVSGMSFQFNPAAPAGRRVGSVKVAGKTLDTQAVYTVATIDFIAAGGDGYPVPGGALKYYGSDAQALADYFAAKPEIREEPEGRVTLRL